MTCVKVKSKNPVYVFIVILLNYVFLNACVHFEKDCSTVLKSEKIMIMIAIYLCYAKNVCNLMEYEVSFSNFFL